MPKPRFIASILVSLLFNLRERAFQCQRIWSWGMVIEAISSWMDAYQNSREKRFQPYLLWNEWSFQPCGHRWDRPTHQWLDLVCSLHSYIMRKDLRTEGPKLDQQYLALDRKVSNASPSFRLSHHWQWNPNRAMRVQRLLFKWIDPRLF